MRCVRPLVFAANGRRAERAEKTFEKTSRSGQPLEGVSKGFGDGFQEPAKLTFLFAFRD